MPDNSPDANEDVYAKQYAPPKDGDPNAVRVAIGSHGAAPDGHPVLLKEGMWTELPPILLAGINFAFTDVPDGANWLEPRGEYKFTHRASAKDAEVNNDPAKGDIVHDLRKPDFIRGILEWIWGRLDIGAAPPKFYGPIFGAIQEAWKCQELVIRDWSTDPYGLEEQWAQHFTELFAGVPYFAHGDSYQFDGFSSVQYAWDEYVYSRIQTKVLPQPRLKGDPGQTVIGKTIPEWNKLALPTKAETGGWVDNEDPAAAIVSACQYVVTHVLLTRGFRIEPAAAEFGGISTSAPNVNAGLTAGPAKGVPAFVFEQFARRGDTLSIEAACKHSPALTPGSVCTFQPYHALLGTSANIRAATKEEADRRIGEIALSVGGNPGAEFDDAVNTHNAANSKLPEFEATVSGQRNGSHINAILRIHRDGKHAQTFEAGAGRLAHYMMEREHKAEALKFHKDVIMDSRAETMLGPNNDQRNGVGYAKPAPDLKAQVEALKKTRPVGLLRLVLTVRSTTPATSGAEDVLFVSRIQRSYGDATHQNFSVSRLMWSLRNTPGFTNIQPWWIVFLPRANVAKAMWAHRAREIKLSQIIADQKRKDGLVMSLDYIDSLILTNMADPCGAVTRYSETKSSPPDGDPHAGLTAVSLSGQPIPKFFRDSLPGKSFSGQQGRVILPQLWGLPTMVNKDGKVVQTYGKVGNVLAWNDSYLRADIPMDGAVPPRFTEEW